MIADTGTDQDAIATAAQLHIPAKNAASYQADGIGVRSTARSISRKSCALRACAAGTASAADDRAAAAPMQSLVEDEDRKARSEP